MLKILCEVRGGVTGYRSAFLKKDGEEVTFTDRNAAEVEAMRLNRKKNGSPYRTAAFQYTVIGRSD